MVGIVSRIFICIASTMLLAGCNFEEDALSRRRSAERDQQVRENMRVVQVAAERYAADHGGLTYPTTIDDEFKSYFPGGIEGQRPAPVGPVNPFSGENQFPTMGKITDVEKVRHGEPAPMQPGAIEYSVFDSAKGYAVVGGAHDGKMLRDINSPADVLVFSNK